MRHQPIRSLILPLAALLLAVACRTGSPPAPAPLDQAAAAPSAQEPWELPVLYEEHRWYVAPVTAGGERLLFYTDSGGGANMIFAPVAERLSLPREPFEAGDEKGEVAPWPELKERASIPMPSAQAPFGGKLLVVPYEGELRMMFPATESGLPREAGFLGRTWFADRVWIFDYPGRRLLLRVAGDVPPHESGHRVDLGFQTGPDGRRTMHFPRIQVEIDGENLDLLFDTGATTMLTKPALAAVGDGGLAIRGASFIAANVFERWRRRHPDWQVIEGAEQGSGEALIEVPAIQVGGYTVGPVWFTRRTDRNFHEYMSQWMDRRIEGALGGSALKYFRVTVDYPNAVAVFEKP